MRAPLASIVPFTVGGGGAVSVEQLGSTLIITINRPETRNAVNLNVFTGIGEALERAEQSDSVRVVVLTGAGDSAFCAGADLKAMARGDFKRLTTEFAEWGFGGFVRHHISKPVIAAVNGVAFGGGAELVLQADLAVAADTAKFAFPEVTWGIMAAAGGAFRLPQQIPQKVAMEILLTGKPIGARRAKKLGLFNKVVPLADLRAATLELAEQIASNAPLAVGVSKRVAKGITDGEIPAEAEAWARSNAEQEALIQTRDAQEGPVAFAEKRAPVWRGE